jgi:hypothetical protein
MVKAKTIRDNSNGTLPASNGNVPDSSKRIELTDANAPLLAVKFLEGIMLELKTMNKHLENLHESIEDVRANIKDV